MRMGGGNIDIISYDEHNNVYLNNKLITGVFRINVTGSATIYYDYDFYSKELYSYVINKIHNKTIGVIGIIIVEGIYSAIIYMDAIGSMDNLIMMQFNILNQSTIFYRASIYNIDNPNEVIDN